MRLLSVFAVMAAGFLAVNGLAEEKKEKAKDELKGAYKKKAAEHEFKIDFKKDKKLEFVATMGANSLTLKCTYKRDKDTVKCTVEEAINKDFPVTKDKGYEFSFKVESKDKSISVSDFQGADIDDMARQALEGVYESASD